MIEQKQKSAASEVKEEPLERQHSDLRLAPVGWTPADADPNDVLTHYDLRLKPVARAAVEKNRGE